MKQLNKTIIISAMAVLMSTSVHAEMNWNNPTGVKQSKQEVATNTNKEPSKFYMGLGYSDRSYENMDGGPMVTVGYNLRNNISLELNHSEVTANDAKFTSISVLGNIKPSTTSKVSYFGRVGYEYMSDLNADDKGYILGAGVDYDVYDNVKLRAEYQYPEIGDGFVNAGLLFNF